MYLNLLFSPSFAFFPCEIREKVPYPEQISITASSSLVIEGNVTVESVKLDGALKLIADADGAKLIVRAGHMVKKTFFPIFVLCVYVFLYCKNDL